MKVKMYSKSWCPFCVAAKAWFDQNDIAYEEIVLDDNTQRTNFYNEMNKSGKVNFQISTVPQIFIDDKHIGGFSDLQSQADTILAKK